MLAHWSGLKNVFVSKAKVTRVIYWHSPPSMGTVNGLADGIADGDADGFRLGVSDGEDGATVGVPVG